MIVYLQKNLANDNKIIYRYGATEEHVDGLIQIDFTRDYPDIKSATGDKNNRLAGLAIGKLILWHKQKKLPDKYVICTG